MSDLPLIVGVKRNSHVDGPGIRSVVFFKGCPLRCVFCQNSEAQDPRVEIAFYERECAHCGACADVCPEGAIDLEFSGRILRDKCARCGQCVEVCPEGGLVKVGKYYTVEDLFEILMRDYSYYRRSGGGVTLSGGECTLYPDYIESLLKLLKAKGAHVVIETSGYFDYDAFREKILPYTDLIYYDVKIADPEAHLLYTGKSNRKILDNLRRLLSENAVEVHTRIPIIPDITSTRNNFSAIVDFLCDAGAGDVSLIPYNPMGMDMYVKLGRERPSLPASFMEPAREKKVYEMFKTIITGFESARHNQ